MTICIYTQNDTSCFAVPELMSNEAEVKNATMNLTHYLLRQSYTRLDIFRYVFKYLKMIKLLVNKPIECLTKN